MLPISKGGLNILKLVDRFKEYERLVQLSSPLSLYLPEVETKQQQIEHEFKKEELDIKSKKTIVKSGMNKNDARSLDLANEKRALSRFNAMPLQLYQSNLTKSELSNGIALRHGWNPLKMPL